MKKISILLLSLLSLMGFAQKSAYQVTSPVELNVMTFSIRLDSEKDGLNNWKNRKDIVANTIRYYEADIIGTQEFFTISCWIWRRCCPAISHRCRTTLDGMEKGEYGAIFYNHNKLTETGSGYFWLSENPLAIG